MLSGKDPPIVDLEEASRILKVNLKDQGNALGIWGTVNNGSINNRLKGSSKELKS